MNSGGRNPAKDPKLEIEQLKLLFDYTKFHIGLYTTLATLVLTALGLKNKAGWDVAFIPWLMWISVLTLGVAGFAGGVIAGTIPQREGFSDFWDNETGPYRLKMLSGQAWTYVEHSSFWLAVIAAVLAFFLPAVGMG